MSSKTIVTYVTSNPYKRKENEILTSKCKLADGAVVGDLFDFRIREASIKEILEVERPCPELR